MRICMLEFVSCRQSSVHHLSFASFLQRVGNGQPDAAPISNILDHTVVCLPRVRVVHSRMLNAVFGGSGTVHPGHAS
jgi:hypothetical protein